MEQNRIQIMVLVELSRIQQNLAEYSRLPLDCRRLLLDCHLIVSLQLLSRQKQVDVYKVLWGCPIIPTAIATYFTLSSTLIASYSTAAKDYNIAFYGSLYLSSRTILLRSSTPFTTSTLLLLKAPYSRRSHKYYRSLFILTISILSRNCQFSSIILALLNSRL